ncbi:MAG TPA: ribonuclease P protein component [Patescibacteria group bacterium]|nr:ribonuclease P protein component [Patescibacteria group bacterium]
MLSKKHRLIKNKDFRVLAKQGNSITNSYLVLKWRKNDLGYSRFGIVVSLKIDKRAARRNRIKRKIREIIRKHLANIKEGYDYLLISRQGIKSKDFNEIEISILRLLKKIDLYDN